MTPRELNLDDLVFPCLFLDQEAWLKLSDKLDDPFFAQLHRDNVAALETLLAEPPRIGSRPLKNRLQRAVVGWYVTQEERYLDLAFSTLILEASFVVQLVLLLLLVASVASWYLIFVKRRTINQAETGADAFEDRFWSGGNLAEIYTQVNAPHEETDDSSDEEEEDGEERTQDEAGGSDGSREDQEGREADTGGSG